MKRFRCWDGKEMLLGPKNASNSDLASWFTAHSDDESIVMQSTGLKDKNGQEIFIGDILATSNSNPEYDIWDKQENGYTTVKETKTLGFSYSYWIVEGVGMNSIYSVEFVEVVGNIYQNPELK